MPRRLRESLQWARRALKDEVLGFTFRSPLQSVPTAGPKDSLEYYLYSDSLSWDIMRLDPAGVPVCRGRLWTEAYCPGYIAWYGLINLGHHLRQRRRDSLSVFLSQVEWLEKSAVEGRSGAAVWPSTIEWQEGRHRLRAPWASAFNQGLALSALVRGYRMTGRSALLDLCCHGADVFRYDVEDGGLRSRCHDSTLYTEYPGYAPPGVLDGILWSLLGLYDVAVESERDDIMRLFREGVDGVRACLPEWDYRSKWSWYGDKEYLSPPLWHAEHCLMLDILGRLANDRTLVAFAEKWNPGRLTAADRLEIYVTFLLTKNMSRLRHRTWRQKTVIGTVDPAG
ncbi:MAG TPA: D-glucuronyl C5-epimerase family protein [Methylomirabilota bacterium]|jgi:hypothetical protein